jgi:hypothetical protein
LQQQSIRRLVLVPPYSVFCSISFRCGGLSIERNQKPLTPENTLAITHHDKQKQVEVKRSSRVNPHEIRLFSGCPYYFTLPMYGNYNSFTKHLFGSHVKKAGPSASGTQQQFYEVGDKLMDSHCFLLFFAISSKLLKKLCQFCAAGAKSSAF